MNVIHELKEYKYLYFCGDVHGQMGELANYTDSIGIKDSIIVTLGDCGFGYIHHKTLKRGILKFIQQVASSNHNLYVFLRGNHDNPLYFHRTKEVMPYITEFPNVLLVDDYDILRTNQGDVLCIGGAFSIDRCFRKPVPYGEDKTDGMNYFEGEEVIPMDHERELFVKMFKDTIRIVATHTAPRFCYPFMWDAAVYQYVSEHPDMERGANEERELVTGIYKTLTRDLGVKPEYWLYGHFHSHMREKFEDTDFILLDRDRYSREKNMTVFDLFEIR